MTQPEETPVSFIPSNFIEKGKILNGTFDIRNAIESIVLSLAIGIPVFHLPLSLTARIIILCMTALPAAMVTRLPEKAKERPDLGGLSSGGKNRKRNRLYHRRTVREDPGD